MKLLWKNKYLKRKINESVSNLRNIRLKNWLGKIKKPKDMFYNWEKKDRL